MKGYPDAVCLVGSTYPDAVCLVGSTKPEWKQRYRLVEEELTKAGYVVLTVVWFRDQLPNFEAHRSLLERIHFQKIRLADAVVLVHKDAKGKHTSQEIKFAQSLDKPVVTFCCQSQAVAELSEKLKEAEPKFFKRSSPPQPVKFEEVT